MATNKNLFALAALGSILLLSAPNPVFAVDVTGTLIRTIDTSVFSPPSPDPSGLAYLSATNTLLDCDGEVDEMTIYQGANLFEMTLSGILLATSTTVFPPGSPYSNEPVGCAFNPANSHLFISDDDKKKVFEIDPGLDGFYNTPDDTRTSFSTSAVCGSGDPEGLAYGEGTLFIIDGVNAEVYKVTPGADGIFNGVGETCTHFDTESLGVLDPEGGEYDPDNPDHLYVVGKKPAGLGQLAYFTTAGTLVRTIGISAASPKKPAGLAATPKNSNSDKKTHVYIADRGVDNNNNPNENDGKVYEFSIPGITPGNQPPTVAAGPNQLIDFMAIANLDGTVVDDGLPPLGPLTTTWSQVSGPGTVAFGNPNAAVTTASFSSSGGYVLRLTADDSELSGSDDVQIAVKFAPSPFATIYVSAVNNGTVGSVSFADEDILAYNTSTETWSMYFHGSDVGLGATGTDVDAFDIMADGKILLSFESPTTITINGIATLVDDSDIVRFIPASLGDSTAGTYEWYFDGSDVGLDTDSEDIDAIGFTTDGKLVVSTIGSPIVPGVSTPTPADEDLLAFSATSLGETTSGTWALYFDGSDVGLSTVSTEDVNGTWIDDFNGDIYLTTTGAFAVTGAGGTVSGGGDDIFKCTPGSTGSVTTCNNYEFIWDGIGSGLPAGALVDGIDLVPALSGSDTTPPTVSITAPVSGSTVSGTIPVSADASDDIGVASVQFKLGLADLGAEDTTAPFSISWNTTTVADNVYTLTAVARDAAGNTTTSSPAVSVTVNNVSVDTTPPTVGITAPAPGATVSGTATPVSANASDNVGVVGVLFKLDGVNDLGSEITTAPFSISWNTTTVANGVHTLTAVARDAAGNTTTSSPAVSVTVDNSGTGATLTFTPTADATIAFSTPTTNFGTASTIATDLSALENFLMKLTVSGIGARPVLSAKLRLYNHNPSNLGGNFYRVADTTWSESTVNWNNAPPAEPTAFASLGAVIKNTWYEVDVKPLITGDGQFSLRVQSTSTDGVDYNSKEAAGFRPELVVTVGP